MWFPVVIFVLELCTGYQITLYYILRSGIIYLKYTCSWQDNEHCIINTEQTSENIFTYNKTSGWNVRQIKTFLHDSFCFQNVCFLVTIILYNICYVFE